MIPIGIDAAPSGLTDRWCDLFQGLAALATRFRSSGAVDSPVSRTARVAVGDAFHTSAFSASLAFNL